MAKATVSKLVKPHTVHCYRRIEPKSAGGSATYRCTLPGCRHYLREEFIVGQIALCPICDKDYQITKHVLYPYKVKKLHCPDCKRATYNPRTKRVESNKPTVSDEALMETLNDIINGKLP